MFSGKTPKEKYNDAWWELRKKYQGVAAPVARTEADFDPGAKYHVPANMPYMRYFLARIYQFQFHRALCKAAGHKGPLETCSIYGNKEAGAKLKAMLALGASRPWPEAIQAIAGERKGRRRRCSNTLRRSRSGSRTRTRREMRMVARPARGTPSAGAGARSGGRRWAAR